MKKNRVKNNFLEHLRKMPNISSACEKLGLSRQTVYRWKKEDKEFATFFDVALSDGEDHINDFVENQLIKKIKEGDGNSIRYYLTKRHKKYKEIKVDPAEKEGNWYKPNRTSEIDSKYFELPDNVDELLAGEDIIPAD